MNQTQISWAALWKRAPLLMPEYVSEWPLVARELAPDDPLCEYERRLAAIPLWARSALCRDAAVRWIAMHPDVEDFRFWATEEGGTWCVQLDWLGGGDWEGDFGSADEALSSACLAILGEP